MRQYGGNRNKILSIAELKNIGMKLFAYRNKEDTVKTNIWEYARAISDTEKQKDYINNPVFYSTHRNINDRVRMCVKRRPHNGFYYFAYYPDKSNSMLQNEIEKKYGSSGESYTHAFLKEIFLSLSQIKIKVYQREITLFDLEVKDEFPIEINEKKYFVDILIRFCRSEPSFYAEEWNNLLIIEIEHAHKNTIIKEKNLRNLRCGIAELNTKKSNYFNFSEEDIQKLDFMEKRGVAIAKRFAEEITYLNFINNPAYAEEKRLDKIEEENKIFITKNIDLQKKFKIVESDNISLKKEIQILNQKFQKLNNENQQLKNQIEDFESSKYGRRWLKKKK